MIIECWWQNKLVALHRCSTELTAAEALQRFGLAGTRYVVRWYPEGRPDQARTIYRPQPPLDA